MSTISIADIVTRYVQPGDSRDQLVSALIQREEAMADTLRLAGVQFGVYSEIVSEVLAEVEMGAPIEPPQREYIRAQFIRLMDELQRQHNEGHGGVQ